MKEITIQQLRKEKEDLEEKLLESIAPLLREFDRKTTISIKSVSTHMIYTQAMGQRRGKYVLECVQADLDLDL